MVYHTVLSEKHALILLTAWSNVSLHMLNSVYALFEIFLTDSPPVPWLMLPVCILVLGGYVGVAYITHLTQQFYPYPFLDPSTHRKTLPLYIIGIALGQCIIFCLIKFLMYGRYRLTNKASRRPVAPPESPESLETWQEVTKEGGSV
jgi:hypothetical protein